MHVSNGSITSRSRTNGTHDKGSAGRKKNSLILSEIAGQVPEEQAYQSKLRTAVYDAVGESDVTEIVQGITKRAKEGDAKAIGQFFDYVMGGKQNVKLVQNNYYDREE